MKIKILLTLISICIISIMSSGQGYIRIDATFFSETLQEEKKIDIYLPGDYYLNPEQEYGTIYYLHGMGGDQNEGNISAMHYYNAHFEDTTISSPPAIFICPDASCEPYRGSYYMNSELYGAYEDYILHDVFDFVESNFRAVDDKNFRMITGMSMGGWGAARLGVKYPDKFRAIIPCSGYLSMPDTMMNFWRTACYLENGSYDLNYNAGSRTQQYFTACGGLSPNLEIPPYYIEVPFDTSGNWVNTTLNKWYDEDPSRKVNKLPDENGLSWFLICGTQDDIICYPTYQDFTDSLDKYNIQYDHDYFEGGHVFNPGSWLLAIHWIDSIMELSFSSMEIPDYEMDDHKLTIYPNPATDRLTVRCPLNENILEVKVYSQNGNIVIHSGGSDQVLDISILSQGIYILEVRTETGVVRGKFIKK